MSGVDPPPHAIIIPGPPRATEGGLLSTLARDLRAHQVGSSQSHLDRRNSLLAEEQQLGRDIDGGAAREVELQRQIDVAISDVDALRATVGDDVRDLGRLTSRRNDLRRTNEMVWAQVRELESAAATLVNPPPPPSVAVPPHGVLFPWPADAFARAQSPPASPPQPQFRPHVAAQLQGISAMSDEQLRRIVAAASTV